MTFFILIARVFQSQTIGPLSRRLLVRALRDEGKDRMLFFTKVRFSHWSSHCFAKSLPYV
jgi:hypothetical protein